MKRNKDNQNKAFAQLLRQKGYKQKQLADELDVKPASVNAWVIGKSKPTPFNLAKMARLLQIDIAELDKMFFGGDEA